MTPRQAEILDALIAHPGMSGRALARLIGAPQSLVAKVRAMYLDARPEGTRTLCLGPGPDHYFNSPDPRRIKFCEKHNYLTHMEQQETYSVVTRG
jgi:hypothetical protein